MKKTLPVVFSEFLNAKGKTLRGFLRLPDAHKRKDHAVVCLPGFERCANETKFTVLANELVDHGISTLRFDYTGLGESDGDFRNTTVEGLAGDFHEALKTIDAYEHASIFAHSLGACVLAQHMKEYPNWKFKRIVLLSPALDQASLQRYYFVQREAKSLPWPIAPEINWENFRSYLDEGQFLMDCKRKERMVKRHYMSCAYSLENQEADYHKPFVNKRNVLVVSGLCDTVVPGASLKRPLIDRFITITQGDHDMERPDLLASWMKPVVNFIAAKRK